MQTPTDGGSRVFDLSLPGSTLAQDSAGRETDIAIDHSEFAHLPAADIARVVAILQSEGMTATVSSIHVNGWYGTHSKWSGAQWMLRRLFGRELEAELARWVYVGDSTNDQVMFERFPASVGVANLMRFAAELAHWPTWITSGERGEGFAELAQADVARALAEDVGGGDLTAALVDAQRVSRGRILAREAAVICGVPWAEAAMRACDRAVSITWSEALRPPLRPPMPSATTASRQPTWRGCWNMQTWSCW